MDCDRVRDLLSDYVKEELPGGARDAVTAHLEGCASCAADAAGLFETLALLSALPREKAPPELLGLVMERIAREAPGPRGWWRKTFSPARVRIPVEAAAAVLFVVLVYGIQRGIQEPSRLPGGAAGTPRVTAAPPRDIPAPAPGATATARSPEKERRAAAGAEGPARHRADSRAAADPEGPVSPAGGAGADFAPRSPHPASPKAESRDPGTPLQGAATATRQPPAAPAAPLPGATAARVSSAAEAIEPKVFAAPPSRLLKAAPSGREVTLEVAAGDRAGIEERIVAAAERVGGGAHPGAAARADSAGPPAEASVRVLLPGESAGAFLDAIKGLGTVPPEGLPASVDLPAGPSPGIVAYTVRIRVR